MNKRIKVILILFALVLGIIIILQPKVHAEFSKDSVVFSTTQLGIQSPASIDDSMTIIPMQVLNKNKTYTVQAVGYNEEEFENVSYYLKLAMGMENEANAELKKAQEEKKWYAELMKTNKSKYESLYNKAVQKEKDVHTEYDPKVAQSVRDYINHAIRYPNDDGWQSFNSDYTIERSKIDVGRYYMLWLKGVDSEGGVMTSPVLYSPPGTLQMVTFKSSLKQTVKSIDIKENYLLENDVTYNKGRKDENTKWTSSDPSILTVSSTGVITGVSNGYAIVTAENEHSRDLVVIYVTDTVRETPVPSPTTTPSTSPSGDSGMTIKREGNDLTISQSGSSSSVPGTTTEQKQDPTVAKGTLPKAGKIKLVVFFIILILAVIIVIRQNFKMRDIK